MDTRSPPPCRDRDAKPWGKKCSRWLLSSAAVGVQVSLFRKLLAKPSVHFAGILPARVLRSVRTAFPEFTRARNTCTARLCGWAVRVVQGDPPQRRHEGPRLRDPFLDTPLPSVNVSARQHSVQVGMKVHFTVRPACTHSPLTTGHRSTRCSTELRGRQAPSPPSRTTSREAPRRAARPFSSTPRSSRGAAATAGRC